LAGLCLGYNEVMDASAVSASRLKILLEPNYDAQGAGADPSVHDRSGGKPNGVTEVPT